MNTTPTIPRAVLIESNSRMRPKTVNRLNEWQYVERSIQRLLAGWGRHVVDFYDKSAVHRLMWEQAECARRLRERIAQFPGNDLELPVSRRLEELGNTILLAPNHEDALDGIFQLLTGALIVSYIQYTRSAHGVHDAPTIATLHEIVGIKEQQRLWFRDYRRRHPHATSREYVESVTRALADCGNLENELPVDAPAVPVGLNTNYRLPARSNRRPEVDKRWDIWPWLRLDFPTDLEARRLFWCYAYLMEKNIPDSQLQWLWDSHYMPWEFQYDLSRHLWDESRHGDSGCSRLLDFGIPLEEIGFPAYGPEGDGLLQPMSKKDLYDAVFGIGMVAETGHFQVKQEAYQDFKDGGDLESAEMMLFDIIDETAHVQYAHRWLPVLAQQAGIENSDYKDRARKMREESQQNVLKMMTEQAQLPKETNADYRLVQQFIERMRKVKPLSNAKTCPSRSPLPV